MMRRRQFLGGLAAAAALPLVGCGSSAHTLNVSAVEAIVGHIVGASFKQGHLLRADHVSVGAGKPRRKVSVAVLGGGVAGLSAAWKLAGSGVDDFRLFELEKVAGGNSRAATYPESRAPWGAHYLPVPTAESTAVHEVLTEMGMLDGYEADGRPRYSEIDLCHEPLERTYAFGAWEEGLYPKYGASPDDLKQYEAFHKHMDAWRKWRDKKGKKAFAIPMELSSREPEMLALDKISMADYMKNQGWTSPRLYYYAEYGTRDDYGTSLACTSAWAGLHYFSCRDGGGFTPKDAQFVWPEGNQRLAQHLIDKVGPARISSGFLVSKIQVDKSGVLIDLIDAETGEAQGWIADRAICAMPTFQRPYLLGGDARPGFTYAPWVVANLVVDSLPRNLPNRSRAKLCWDNVIYGSPSLGYVVATHQDVSTGDHQSVLTWYRPFIGEDPRKERQAILDRDWKSWRDEIVGELSPIHPGIESTIRRLDVMLLGHAMIRPATNFMWSEERMAAALPHPPLFFAHSDLSGLSIFEHANYHGVRAAQELMADMKHEFRDSLRA